MAKAMIQVIRRREKERMAMWLFGLVALFGLGLLFRPSTKTIDRADATATEHLLGSRRLRKSV